MIWQRNKKNVLVSFVPWGREYAWPTVMKTTRPRSRFSFLILRVSWLYNYKCFWTSIDLWISEIDFRFCRSLSLSSLYFLIHFWPKKFRIKGACTWGGKGVQRRHEPHKNDLPASRFAEWPLGPVYLSPCLSSRLQASASLSPLLAFWSPLFYFC